jgi:hypothetical protein
MSFMQPEIYRGDFFEIDSSDGTWIIPADTLHFILKSIVKQFKYIYN